MRNKQDATGKSRGSARRRYGARGAFNSFEWDSVDDAVQEDMIEPVAAPEKPRKHSKRRDKDVGTMYVANAESDVYAPVKKKPVRTLHAEDYAGFVAEVGEDEVDPYAIPSYGQTRLTHSDEELVEELAVPKEKERRRPERRRAESAPREEDAPAAPAREPRGKTARAENRETRDNRAPREERAPRAAEGQGNGRKRSFLSKIKEAISTGAVSGSPAAAPASHADAQEPRVPAKTMIRLTRSIAKVAGAANLDVKVEYDESASQTETLISWIETLVEANEALAKKISELSVAETESAEKSGAKAEQSGKDRETPAGRGRRRAPAREAEESESRVSEPETRPVPARRGKPAPAPVETLDDDFDPIAIWENMPDDEPEDDFHAEIPERSAREDAPRSGRRAPEDDFEDFEAGSKKKSARFQEDEEARPVLEEENAVKKERRSKRRADKERPAPNEEQEKLETGPLEKFGELTLKKTTLKALQLMGYVAPTPIQAGTIPRIQAGVDLMGQAKTGTGKTAAFMIPIVEGVAECEPCGSPLALVVVPTRELAVQARDETQRLAKFVDLSVAACYGGKPIASQVEKLRRGVDILLGTPGRIIDLMNRGALSLSKIRWIVLDEADRMLDIGFRPDVEKILRRTPKERQTLLFSATLAPPVVRLAKAYMKEPEQFDFSQKDVAADTIEQFCITVDKDRKFEALVALLEFQKPQQAIVFCRTKRHVDMVARRLAAKIKNVEAIHGDLQQSKRDHIMRDFRAEKIRVLVATDIVGRGIDVSTVSHIVNYDIPQYCDDYVHRVGRAGRMGREGVAFTLVTAEEGAELTRIEIRINKLLERFVLPGFEAVSKPVEAEQQEERERKPVFGQRSRRVRRAL